MADENLKKWAELLLERSKSFPKPNSCPFCGETKTHLSADDKYPKNPESLYGSWWVWCDNCLCQGPHGCWPENAIESWNLRIVNDKKESQIP